MEKFGSPLYRQVYTRILRELDHGTYREGDFLPPERELASNLGVGVVTVRHALRMLQAEGRIQRRRGQGTRVVAPPPVTIQGQMVAVVGGGETGVLEERDAALVEGLLGQPDIAAFLCGWQPRVRTQWLRSLTKQRPGAVVLLNPPDRSADLTVVLNSFTQSGVPVVVDGDFVDAGTFDVVGVNHRLGSRRLAAHLLGQSERHVGLLLPGSHRASPRTEHMLAGFIEAVTAAGGEFEDDQVFWIRDYHHHRMGHTLHAAYMETLARLRTMERTPGTLILGPSSDVDLVRRAMEALVIPEERQPALVPYENQLGVPGPSLDLRRHEVGSAMAELAIGRLRRSLPPKPQEIWIEPDLLGVEP